MYKKMYSFYRMFFMFICVFVFLITGFVVIYGRYIHNKFKFRNIDNADIIIESTEKFTEQEIQEFVEIAKADFIKYDILLGMNGIKQDKFYVLNSLNFIEENELIKTKDVIVFLADYDFYKEPLYYLFGKKISDQQYWYFVRDSETNQYQLEIKKGDFSPDDIYQVYTNKLEWRVRDN